MNLQNLSRLIACAVFTLLFSISANAQSTKANEKSTAKKAEAEPANIQQVLIDKFMIPSASLADFKARMAVNRKFIKTLPGFVKDDVYSRTDAASGYVHIVTLAVWKNETEMKKAKEAVQAKYTKEEFNMPEFLDKLGIKMERGQYELVKE
ncbi:MAG: hypothetical protein V4543_18080 [Bacteroidota bacterium]